MAIGAKFRRLHEYGMPDGVCVLGILAIVLTACAASPAGATRAQRTAYAVRRDVLWSRVVEALRAELPGIVVNEMDATRLQTSWYRYRRRPNNAGTLYRNELEASFWIRVTVLVSGTNPYRIQVELELGVYQYERERVEVAPDTRSVTRRKKEAIEEAIYERLREHAAP